MLEDSKFRGGQLRQFTHSGRLGLRYFAAVSRQSVIAAALVVEMRVWAVIGFLN